MTTVRADVVMRFDMETPPADDELKALLCDGLARFGVRVKFRIMSLKHDQTFQSVDQLQGVARPPKSEVVPPPYARVFIDSCSECGADWPSNLPTCPECGEPEDGHDG